MKSYPQIGNSHPPDLSARVGCDKFKLMVGIHRSASWQKKQVVTALAVIALVVSAAMTLAVIHFIHLDPGLQALQAAQATSSYPLYYPKHLPQGYGYKAGSMSTAHGVTLFVLLGPKGEQLAVTEQAKPQGFDFSQLSGTAEFQVPLGSAYVEDFNNRTTGSIVTDQTWVILNTYTPIGSDVMREILSSFQ